MNYQGRLSSDGLAFTGVGQFKFALVNTDASQTFWGNSADINRDGEPDAGVLVSISRGIYSVLLGDTNVQQMAALPASVFTNAFLNLRVWFTDGASPFERLEPDQRLAAVGFAVMAAMVPDGSITTAKLASGALIATNLVGSLATNQIPELDAGKITSGVLNQARIPTLDASRISSGIFPTNRLPVMDAVQIGTGVFDSARIPVLDASRIGSGTIDAARLPELNASRITSGSLPPGVIPTLDASKIGSGTLDPNRIPSVDSSKISGTIPAALLPGLDASQVVSGRFSPTILPQNVAYTDTHLSDLYAQVATLTARLDAHSAGSSVVPPGSARLSTKPNDAVLVSGGFEQVMSMPPPSWITSAAPDGPSPRSEHATIWAQNMRQIFIWGGQLGPNSYSQAGALYDPALDQWRPITTAGAPSPRRGHSMIYDGVREAFTWGGFTANGYTNDGARFDLAGASWSSLSSSNAPSPREGHVAVFLNPLMLIWGGRNSSGLLNDGAVYDITSDQWRALNLNGPPSARLGATAVRADNRILVWGGTGETGVVNTGSQLVFLSNPALEPLQWNPIGALNAPSARTGHAAVWTGSRMIIWGGRSGDTFFNDGALLDPIAGTWTAMSSSDAPLARSGAAAVWSGQELLVFGGETASGSTATGGAYNPATDTWRPLSSLGSPVSRHGASGIWTDSELILFGGQSGAAPVASLQRLTPQPAWYLYRKL